MDLAASFAIKIWWIIHSYALWWFGFCWIIDALPVVLIEFIDIFIVISIIIIGLSLFYFGPWKLLGASPDVSCLFNLMQNSIIGSLVLWTVNLRPSSMIFRNDFWFFLLIWHVFFCFGCAFFVKSPARIIMKLGRFLCQLFRFSKSRAFS